MRKKLVIAAGVVLVLGLLGAALIVPAMAQDPTPTPEPKVPFGWGERGLLPKGGFLGFGVRGGSWAAYDDLAAALKLTPEELFSELHAGKSLADIAEAQGVDLAQVQESLQSARTERMRDAIEQAVTDERLTRDQADWLLQGLDLGFMPGRGGPGWGHGMKGHFCRPAPDEAGPSPSSL